VKLILRFLEADDLARARRVCKKWHEFCSEESIWKDQCLKRCFALREEEMTHKHATATAAAESPLGEQYKLLEEENARLSASLLRARRVVSRLNREKNFILGRLLQYEGWEASDSGTDSISSEDDEGASDPVSDSDQPSEVEPPTKKAKRTAKRDRLPSPREEMVSESETGLCVAVVKKRPCKSKALTGFKYCWHHAPLDPNSPFTWCQFVDTTKKKNKKCSIPVLKTKPRPFCKYHEQKMDDDGGGKQKAGLQVEQVSATSKEKDTSLQPTPYHHGEDDAGGLELTDEEGGALMITEDSDADQPDEDELV
jgi:hypothetical protein